MKLRIFVDPEAEAEIGDAASYEDRLPGLGLEFLAAVDRAFSSIGDDPESFPRVAVGSPDSAEDRASTYYDKRS